MKFLSAIFCLTLVLLFSSQAFSKKEDEEVKHGPRFDYYNLRGKPMRHGLLFQAQGVHKDDDMKLKAASATNGKKVYQELCIHCHGPNGKGDGKIGKELVMRPADLSKLAENFPSYHFFVQITEGKRRDMPAWQDAIEPKEICDLIAYIKTLK